MRVYVCDWCKRPKLKGERWILGFAAERVGASGAQVEFSLAAAWSDEVAEHPFAVHFCGQEHKDCYVAALFGRPAAKVRNPRASAPRGRTRQKHSSKAQASSPEISVDTDMSALETRSKPKVKHPQKKGRRKAARSTAAPFSKTDAIRLRGLGINLDDNKR